jgi:hypothetical protein
MLKRSVVGIGISFGVLVAAPPQVAIDRNNNPLHSRAITIGRTPESYLADREARLTGADSELDRCLLLPDVALAAVEAGQLTKAKAYAAEAARLVEKLSPDGTLTGASAYYYTHLALGRIALAEGRIEVAKAELLLSGKTDPSPSLIVKGPNLSLAQDLLAHGERDVVVTFLEDCKRFWIRGEDKLSVWQMKIRDGSTPDFSANFFIQ